MRRKKSTRATSHNYFSETLRRQKYQIAGAHSAVKKCRWLHNSLVQGKPCFKERFYGIQSHRCLQMTPTLACNLRCRFCWRTHPEDLGASVHASDVTEIEEPQKIVEESIHAQRRMLSGYRSQVLKGVIDEQKYREALNPCHAAISLEGEPTLYRNLGGLLAEFKSCGFTAFLVTNGTQPAVLRSLDVEPTQLYLSLYAPDEEGFTSICNPLQKNLWAKVREGLSALTSFSCPTVIRLTLAKGLNMVSPEKYGKIIAETEPTYVEAKAYMYVGYSRRRLRFEHMPQLHEVLEFSERISKETGYNIIDASPDSRVVLLSRLRKPKKLAARNAPNRA